MNKNRTINFFIVTLLIFSIWIAFALLVVNPYLHPYIPGYQVGKPCGWEFVALGISASIAFLWTRNWVSLSIQNENGVRYINISLTFVVFLLAYMTLAIGIFIWQYTIFSAGFK